MRAFGDARFLRVILENLIGNAWKFTANEPSAVIEVGTFDRNGHGPGYFVRDNGAGFDMHFAHKLFAVFQRLHTEKEFEGSGVGLATVQRIVERHGGRVWAEGNTGAGATFFFTLGVGPAVEHPHPAPGETADPLVIVVSEQGTREPVG